jgi:ABC-type antimicrobial peptide transport system permease subunit
MLYACTMVGVTIHRLQNDERFFNPYDYMCTIIAFDKAAHADDAAKARVGSAILAELRQNPKVEKAMISTEIYNTETYQWGSSMKFWIDGAGYADEDHAPHAMFRVVSSGYFDAEGVPILAGRDFTEEDDTNHPLVAAVTDVFAEKYFGTRDALGKQFRVWGANGPAYTVVAVVPDIYNSNARPGLISGFFIPFKTAPWSQIPLMIKAHGTPAEIETLVRDAVQKVDDRVITYKFMNMGEMRDYHGFAFLLKLVMTFFAAFAAGAAVMAGSGLFGIISISVQMRRRETGIRLALGASPRTAMLGLAAMGLRYVAYGMIVGVLLSQIIRHLLLGSLPLFYNGPLAYIIPLAILTGISAAAILLPAFRSAYSNPGDSLRDD